MPTAPTHLFSKQFETEDGCVLLTDFMPLRGTNSDVIRRVTGVRGQVPMRSEMVIRFDYGRTVPWVSRLDDGTLRAIAGPHMLVLRTGAPLCGEGLSTVSEFTVSPGEIVDFTLTYGPSHLPPPPPIDADEALADTQAFWRDWEARCQGGRQFWTGPGRWSAGAACENKSTTRSAAAPTTHELGAFVQTYGGRELDASLLLMPLVGFLSPQVPRMLGTVAAIQRHLSADGLLLRYNTGTSDDGLPPGEGAFLACSFWLADNLVLQGRHAEARTLFERLLALCNDVGLLAEEFDPRSGRMLGNFPQAFSHVALVNTALNLTRAIGPADQRSESRDAEGVSQRDDPMQGNIRTDQASQSQ